VKPAVSEVAILLEAMLPAGTRLPATLRYTIARALLNVDAPPFDSIEELSSALARFERNDRDAVIRDLVDRARAATATAAIIPFKPAMAVRVRPERRHPMPASVAAELRRDLRRAELERYVRQAVAVPDLRGVSGRRKRPLGAVMAAVGAGIVLIASGELMSVGPADGDLSTPPVRAPSPDLPDPASAHQLPAHALSPAPSAPRRAPTGSFAVERVTRPAPVHRPQASRQRRELQSARAGRGDRGGATNGVLARLHLGWVRTLFTYRPDL
jgi:hypothetical protein